LSISGDTTPFWPEVVSVGSDTTLLHRLECTLTATVEDWLSATRR